MNQWSCCRLCLSMEFLHPIFTMPEHNNKYTSIILITTGVKVELNDDLPQEICSSCIHFVNRCYKYRKKCELTQTELSERLKTKQFYDIKVEIQDFKMETELNVIDISELLVDDDFKDYDDNVTLDTFCNEKTEQNDVTTEKNILNITDEPLEIFNNKKRRKKCREMDREDRKKERVREEVECEYCHKILTSKLSLRNHYKIHTGFDVVCEHCGKKFITRRLLLMHCRARHGYEKTDKCSYCDYRASNAEQVKIHERLHTGEKPFVCSACGAGFHRKSSYLQHVAIHLPEKTVQCDECPARFKSTTLMRIHKNRHRAPQYTFKCLVCDNNFARKRNVGRHLQRIHGLTPDSAHIERVKIS